MTLLIVLALWLAPPAKSPPKWEAYADCAAAYRVNAALKDPGRPPTMSADMADIGRDYAKAAVAAAPKSTSVEIAINKRAPRFSAMSREQLDAFIERCPQLGE